MRGLYKVNTALSGLQFACLVVCASAGSAQTQQNDMPPALEAKLNMRQNEATLDATLHLVQSVSHINIVADGEPALQTASLECVGTVRDALNSIADAYGYKWTLTRSGTVLMSKQFNNAKQRPQMHLSEMQQMAKEIRRALALAPITDSNARPNPLLRQLLVSLSPEQYRAISGTQTFYARDLRPEQFQVFAQSVWLFNMPQTYQKWDVLSSLLAGFPKSYLTADPVNTSGREITENGIVRREMHIDVSHIVRDQTGQLHNKRIGEPTIIGPEGNRP